jgi:hypothetical protein
VKSVRKVKSERDGDDDEQKQHVVHCSLLASVSHRVNEKPRNAHTFVTDLTFRLLERVGRDQRHIRGDSSSVIAPVIVLESEKSDSRALVDLTQVGFGGSAMRIGVLTAGGDAPGLNAAIRAIGQMAIRDGHEVIGIANGWAGLAAEYAGRPLVASDLQGVIAQGGTLLGTARYNLDKPEGGRQRVLDAIDEHLDALISIGGDGTHRISSWLAERGAPIVGVPKTLDNDLLNTDYCIGFDTAISIVAESIDRLYTTAASHHRVMVVETMGRLTGWVAAMGGLAGGADMIVIPEFPVTMDDIMTHLERRQAAGLAFSIVVVAEGVNLATLGGTEIG